MENGEESFLVNPEKLDDDDEVLRFLDSLDAYLRLRDSVSSMLRQTKYCTVVMHNTCQYRLASDGDGEEERGEEGEQEEEVHWNCALSGWFELATARHSMGSSRVSSVVLDQKVQPAATTLQVRESVSGSHINAWSSSAKDGICSSEEIELSSMQTTVKDSELRHRGTSSFYDDMKKINSTINLTPTDSDSNIQKERSKMLSVFGTLVSPKLRAAQVSFETALDGIVEIANVQSTLLSSFSRLQQERNDSS
ncbi:hypothetical protein ZIOFF_064249 [Zingiber officinale]|uniref:Vacuolar ATPase assembly protein VMA22 n=1 Tax=Zingiber officinale TaxID=94328 RepID=A0A8J5EVR8_ZINOF|nr:hypothetical protein ZIOFF_064249 [Zingiber officinale]